MAWYFIVILVLVAFIGGYITKDMLTIEKKVEITFNKLKVRGRGTQMIINAEAAVEEKKIRKRFFKKR